jgi:acetyl-CoA C-acetyltransferase
MKESFIYDGIRTPFGRYGGVLARLRPDDMAAMTISELVKRHPAIREEIEDVILGDSNQAGEDSRNIARNAALIAGFPVKVSGITLNRLCGSGLAAAVQASNSIKCGEGDLFIAGGVESMTRAPLVLAKAEHAFQRTAPIADSTIGWRFPNESLISRYGAEGMPETAENIARHLHISREESDRYAYDTQMRYEAARKAGFYTGEIMPVEVPAASRKLPPLLIEEDEHPRPDTNAEKLANLRSLHVDGIVTAGNASGVNDGAAALLVGSASAAERLDLKPMAKILTSAVAGVEPGLMGLGPVPASIKALERAGLSLDDMDLIEINEAFAVQVLGCMKKLNLASDDRRINPNGGAIAIGHPLGASGARLLLTAYRELRRRKGKYALVSLCIGIGQGIATIIENTDTSG